MGKTYKDKDKKWWDKSKKKPTKKKSGYDNQRDDSDPRYNYNYKNDKKDDPNSKL